MILNYGKKEFQYSTDIHLWSFRANRVIIIRESDLHLHKTHKTNTSSLPDKEQTFLADYLSATPAQGDCLQVADPRPRDGGCEAGVMCDVEISGVT